MNNDSTYRVIADNISSVESAIEETLRAEDVFGDNGDLVLSSALILDSDRDKSLAVQIGWYLSDEALLRGDDGIAVGVRYFSNWRSHSRAWASVTDAATRAIQDQVEKFDGRRPSSHDVMLLLNRAVDGDHFMDPEDEGDDGFYVTLGGITNLLS